MTRMTGPDCAVMCKLINTHTHTNTVESQHGWKCFLDESTGKTKCLKIRTKTFVRSVGRGAGILYSTVIRRYFQNAHFLPIILGVGKRGAYCSPVAPVVQLVTSKPSDIGT